MCQIPMEYHTIPAEYQLNQTIYHRVIAVFLLILGDMWQIIAVLAVFFSQIRLYTIA